MKEQTKNFLKWFVKAHVNLIYDSGKRIIGGIRLITVVCAIIIGIVGLIASLTQNPDNPYQWIYTISGWWYLLLFLMGYLGFGFLYYKTEVSKNGN